MFTEPMPSVLRKTVLGSVGGAAIFTWILQRDVPLWYFALANFSAAYCVILGGHFLERVHIRYFEPKLMKHPVENASVRIMIWILGGGLLVQASLAIWRLWGTPQFEGIQFWMGGVFFALFQLAALHPVMWLLRLNSFYNNKG